MCITVVGCTRPLRTGPLRRIIAYPARADAGGGVVGLFSSCNRRVHPVDGTPNRMGKGPSPSLKVFVDHSSLRYLVNYVGYIIVYTARAGYRHAIDLTAGM